MLPAAVLLVSVASLAGVPVRKGYYALAERVDAATFICIGRVTEIIEVATPEAIATDFGGRAILPFARVTIERVIKGSPKVAAVYHEAWPTWACDSTDARVGQRGLFLLAPGAIAKQSDAVRDTVGAALAGNLPLCNVGSGDGLLPIETVASDEVLYCSGAPQILDSEAVRYGSRLRDAVAYIEEVCAFPIDALTVHVRNGTASSTAKPSSTFDLRILDDGRVRVATSLGAAERVSTFELEPDTWSTLRRELELTIADQHRIVGDPKPRILARRLTLRFARGSLTYAESVEGLPPAADHDEQFARQDAMTAWKRLRAAFHLPPNDDSAASDRSHSGRR